MFVRRFTEGGLSILLLDADDILIIVTKQILGKKISCNKKNSKLWLSQENFIKVLDKFSKPLCSQRAGYLKLSSKQSPTGKKEKEEMQNMSYTSTVGSLIQAMVCTKSNIAHPV